MARAKYTEMESKFRQALEMKDLQIETIEWRGRTLDKTMLFAEHNGEVHPFGLVGHVYTPITHGEIHSRLTEWLPDAKFEGMIFSSRKNYSPFANICFTYRMPQTFEVGGQEIQTWINVRNSYDGSAPVGIYVTPMRVVCRNQFRLLHKKSYFTLQSRHTKQGIATFRRDIKLVEQINNAMKQQVVACEVLRKSKITTSKGQDLLEKFVEQRIVAKSVAKEAEQLWVHPIRKEDEARDLWTLINTVTEPLNRKLETSVNIGAFNRLDKASERMYELLTV